MAQKISVVIPNYNGSNLLAKNLPTVIKNCPGAEIIVVDDASSDNSVSLVRENFKNIKLVSIPVNKGFSNAVDTGVSKANSNLVLILNSDVSLSSDVVKRVITYFDNPKTFAVALADKSHEGNKIVIRGRGNAKFQKGFLTHFAINPKKGKTLWVSGGSGLFDRNKFMELGGFDRLYAPFYWEDIDLSYRAWKAGWQCFFEPSAQVDHYHEEGAIKKHHSQFKIKSTSYRNQFLFVWKNVSDYSLLVQHLLWLPYHFAKGLVRADWAFFAGFFSALPKVPQLVFNWQMENGKWEISDREVLNVVKP